MSCFIKLCTYPETDNGDCKEKEFSVPKDWLIDVLDRMDALNERSGVDLDNFLQNYTYAETEAIYNMAKAAGKLKDGR